MRPKTPTNKVLRDNYKDLQGKYIRLVHLLHDIREAVGLITGPVNEPPEVVRKPEWIPGNKPDETQTVHSYWLTLKCGLVVIDRWIPILEDKWRWEYRRNFDDVVAYMPITPPEPYDQLKVRKP